MSLFGWKNLLSSLISCYIVANKSNVDSGTVMRRWKPSLAVGSRGDIEVCLRASHLSVLNDQKTLVLVTNETISHFQQFWTDHSNNPLRARDLIIASICPHVYLFPNI